jgi:hypothetical protein
MATAYPAALDSLTNPTAGDPMNSVTVPHATQHANINDAMEAVQATLGVSPQGSSSTVSARIAALEGGSGGSFAALSATGGTSISNNLTARATSAVITCDGTVAVSAQVTANDGAGAGFIEAAVRLFTSPGNATVATSPTFSQDSSGTASSNKVTVPVSHLFTGVAAGSYTVALLVGRSVTGTFTVDQVGGFVQH